MSEPKQVKTLWMEDGREAEEHVRVVPSGEAHEETVREIYIETDDRFDFGHAELLQLELAFVAVFQVSLVDGHG